MDCDPPPMSRMNPAMNASSPQRGVHLRRRREPLRCGEALLHRHREQRPGRVIRGGERGGTNGRDVLARSRNRKGAQRLSSERHHRIPAHERTHVVTLDAALAQLSSADDAARGHGQVSRHLSCTHSLPSHGSSLTRTPRPAPSTSAHPGDGAYPLDDDARSRHRWGRRPRTPTRVEEVRAPWSANLLNP